VTQGNAIVFVVDDDLRIRESLHSLLSMGFPVAAFGSAAEVLAAQRPACPSCLVLDLKLARHERTGTPATTGQRLCSANRIHFWSW
jgi:FixJ family two-component response regulator